MNTTRKTYTETYSDHDLSDTDVKFLYICDNLDIQEFVYNYIDDTHGRYHVPLYMLADCVLHMDEYVAMYMHGEADTDQLCTEEDVQEDLYIWINER